MFTERDDQSKLTKLDAVARVAAEFLSNESLALVTRYLPSVVEHPPCWDYLRPMNITHRAPSFYRSDVHAAVFSGSIQYTFCFQP